MQVYLNVTGKFERQGGIIFCVPVCTSIKLFFLRITRQIIRAIYCNSYIHQ